MAPTRKSAWALLVPTLWFVEVAPASALQSVDASDGVTVEAVLSLKEPTRIRIDGDPIVNVFGNIHSSNCGANVAPVPGMPGAPPAPLQQPSNPAGEIVVECDPDKGEIYVRPVGGPGKPVNLFVASQHATYTLLLRRSDTPADTIVIRDKTPRPAATPGSAGDPAGRPALHIRSLKALLVAMASDHVPTDIRVEEVNRTLQLWAEARFALTRTYEGRGLVGERYLLTNISAQNMVLTEQEFDRSSGAVLGVCIETHNLLPGESTAVYVIRRGV